MIERLGFRAVEFVDGTLKRFGKAAASAVDRTPPRSAPRRVLTKVAPIAAATAGALGLAATKLRDRVDDGGTAPKPQAKPKSKTARSTSSKPKASSNGSGPVKKGVEKAAEKTREELYELARKADIPGRSAMTKEELEKALKKG